MSFHYSAAISHKDNTKLPLVQNEAPKVTFRVLPMRENSAIRFPISFRDSFPLEHSVCMASLNAGDNERYMRNKLLTYHGSIKALTEACVHTEHFAKQFDLDSFKDEKNQIDPYDVYAGVGVTDGMNLMNLVDHTETMKQLFSRNYGQKSCDAVVQNAVQAYQHYQTTAKVPVYNKRAPAF